MDIRMRGKSKAYKQIILSFNPSRITLAERSSSTRKRILNHHESTYKDKSPAGRGQKSPGRVPRYGRILLHGLLPGAVGVTGKTVYDGQKVTEGCCRCGRYRLLLGTLLYRLDDAERIIPDSITFSEDKNGPINIYEWPTRKSLRHRRRPGRRRGGLLHRQCQE